MDSYNPNTMSHPSTGSPAMSASPPTRPGSVSPPADMALSPAATTALGQKPANASTEVAMKALDELSEVLVRLGKYIPPQGSKVIKVEVSLRDTNNTTKTVPLVFHLDTLRGLVPKIPVEYMKTHAADLDSAATSILENFATKNKEAPVPVENPRAVAIRFIENCNSGGGVAGVNLLKLFIAKVNRESK